MIYILLLEKGKFYVGFTDRYDGQRFSEHILGKGSEWTKKYPVVEVLEWRKGSLNDENTITLEMMKKYGWWNVRGGKWCTVNMKNPPKELLANIHIPCTIDELKEESEYVIVEPPACLRCGRSSHYEDTCYARTHIRGYYISNKN